MRKPLALALAGILLGIAPAAAELATLDQVVVTATRTPQPRSEVAASIAVVTADEIAARGATRLDDVLQDIAGLHLVSQGPAGSLTTASIRGSSPQQVLVMLDGIRLNSPQLGLADLGALPVALEEIERIEVLRGPASALYGSNALGGVIHIITKQPEAAPRNRVSWSEGRAETRRVGASTARRLEGMRYRLGVETRQSQGYRENSDYDQVSLDALLGATLPHHYDLELNAYYLDRENGAPGPLSFLSTTARQSDQNTLVNLTLGGPAGPAELQLRGSYERRENRFLEPAGFFPADDTHLLTTSGLELQTRFDRESHELVVGGDLYDDDLESTANGDHDQQRGAVFAQLQLQALERLQLLFGLRYDVHSDFANELSPRAAALLSLSDATRLRASASRAFRAPTLNDRFWPDDGFSVGNPNLSPETAWEYELALDQGLGALGGLTLAGFVRDADDLINWAPIDPTDPASAWQPTNVSDARIWGAEAGVDLNLCAMAAAGANYTWLYARDRETDAYLPGKPRHQLHGYLALGPIRQVSLRLDGRYVGYYAADTGRQGFTVFDAALSRPLTVGRVDLDMTLAAKNLFDRAYQINPGYPMPPQEFQLALSAAF